MRTTGAGALGNWGWGQAKEFEGPVLGFPSLPARGACLQPFLGDALVRFSVLLPPESLARAAGDGRWGREGSVSCRGHAGGQGWLDPISVEGWRSR